MTTATMTTTPATVAAFRFQREDHTYWLGPRRLESVTEVLVGVGITDLEYVTPQALSRGSAVHHACHLLDTKGLKWATLHPDLHGYVRAWEKCRGEEGMEIIDSEQARYHPVHLFAGTRDKRVIWGGKTYKLDIKTVSTPGAKGPRWAAEQTAAYDMLEPGIPEPDGRASIILYPDGSWKPEIHYEYADAIFFMSYLTTYRRLKFHGRI